MRQLTRLTKRWAKRLGLAWIALALVMTFAAPRNAVAVDLAAAQATLRRYDMLMRPNATDGPPNRSDQTSRRPAVMLFHGCGGIEDDHYRDWAAFFVARGYVALIVDSFAGRVTGGVGVCSGLALWGRARAVDVAASLAYLRGLPFVDPARIAAVGWSHGGWSVLDALALADRRTPKDERLTLTGLRAVVALYPYCGRASLARDGWRIRVPTLLLLAGADETVSAQDCRRMAQRQQRAGRPVRAVTYPGAGHDFDYDDDGDDMAPAATRPNPDAVATARAKVEIAEFLKRQFGR
jgi:dienelactone hydrolase